MPIIDIELVQADGAPPPAASLTQALADAAARVLGSAPGRTWVRLHGLPAAMYAENETVLGANDLPAFVTVLHARPPQGEALAREAAALTQAVADGLGCAPQRVHVQYAAPGAGRQAFGGVLVPP
jgi:phenylpyruvate tautomerase PptA (4-oxalocrotonate tautomerase family)